jgi:uncharacterized phosphosugar-binding protein
MDEQVEEMDEVLSEGSAAEEEDQMIDNRSIVGDGEVEIPSYFCNVCKVPHFQKCFISSSTLSTCSD